MDSQSLYICHNKPVVMPQDYQIRFRSILEYESSLNRSYRIPTNHQIIKDQKTYSGNLTTGARKRIERACELFIQSTPEKYIYNQYRRIRHKHHMSFITLTLQLQDYKLVDLKKNVFQPWIRKMQRDYKLNKYVWKLEFTQNKMPHFHIITDSWIDYKVIRKEWNLLLAKYGYLNKYFKEHAHYNANSTDVRSSKNSKRSVAYMVKYVCKDIDTANKVLGYFDYIGSDKIGKVWDCSLNLKKFKLYSTIAQSYHDTILDTLISAKSIIKKCFDNFNIYIFLKGNPTDILSQQEKEEYNLLIHSINSC